MGWYSRVRVLPSVKTLKTLFLSALGWLILFSFSSPVYADDFHSILNNLQRIIAPLTAMVMVICFCFGIFLIFRALGLMKKFGNMQNMHSTPGDLSGPLTYLVVGAILIYLPTSSEYMMNSLFGTVDSVFSGGSINYQALGTGASLISYSGSGSLGQYWADLANTLILFIQFLGFLSFVKGWFILSKAGNPGNQPGSMTKGMTHVIGGVGLINIVGVIDILKNTVFGT